MPAQVVVVHDEAGFLEEAVAALRAAGCEVAAYLDPFAALDALDRAKTAEVLVTRIGFPPGNPNGVALAMMARRKRPGIRVIFTTRPEYEPHTEGIGELVPHPVSMPALVEAVGRALAAG